MTARVDI